MDLISILVAAAAVVLAAALSAAATVFVVRRRVPPEARSLVFEREPAAAGVPEKRSPGRGRPAPLPELPGPLRPGAAHRPDPVMSLYVKPGRQAAEILILDERGLLEYARIDDGPRHGDVYLGEVVGPDPGGTGLFVDIGEGARAFLDLNGGTATGRGPGDRILCRLTGLPREAKGYQVSDRVGLRGRYVTLLRDRPDVMATGNLYQHLDDADAALLSRKWKERCAAGGRGVMVRDGAGTASRALYEKDFGYLMERMRTIERRLEDPRSPAPARLDHASVHDAALEAVQSALDRADGLCSVTVVGGWRSKFIADLKAQRSRSGSGALASLKIPRKSVYDRGEIEAPLDEMRGKLAKQAVKVPCRSGANLVIEQTEALISVDVNSAGARRHDAEDDEDYALRINSEAADTLARALRLLNLGGIVVVDFIDMAQDSARERLRACVRRSFERHEPLLRGPAEIDLGSVSPTTGVLDLTRRRDGYSLWEGPSRAGYSLV